MTSLSKMHSDGFRSFELTERWQWASMGYFFAFFAVLITMMVIDGEGRKDYHHTTPIPAKVAQVSSYQYVLQPGAKVTADDICQFTDADGSRIQSNKRVGAITYVECGHSQYWNDHRAASPDLVGAAGIFVADWRYMAPVIFFLLLCTQLPVRYWIAWERAQRREEKAARPKQIDMEKARLVAAAEIGGRYDRLISELKVEWTKPNTPMTDDAFETKLGDLEQKRDAELNNL